MRFFALVTLLGLALFPAFTQTTKPKKSDPPKTAKKATPGKTTSALKPKPTPKKTTATNSSASKPKPKTTAANSKPKPKKPVTPPKKLDEKAEWEKASNVPDTAGRVAALQKFNETFPKSDKRTDALELISATRGQMGNEKMVAGDITGAVALFKLAATETPKPISDPLFTESLSKFPANLFFRGERDAAFEIAKTLEEKADANVGQLLNIASFYMSVENGTEAKRVAENAIRLNPESSPAWQTLGLANRMDFLLDESATAYGKALAVEPDSLAARRGLAEMKRSLGKADEAVTLYREILAKDAENLPAQTGLVLALFDAEKRTDAEAELAKSLAANPGNVILLASAAYWYAAHNEGERAVDLAQKSIAVDPRFIWSHIAWARGLMVQKKPIEAEKILLAARRYGEFPTLEYEMASARLAAGFYRDAAEELAKSFSVKDGVVSTKLGGRVPRESRSFIELVGPERRASIFAPTAADDPENAARLTALLELKQQLDAAEPKADAVAAAADAFIRGDDKMKVHRQIFAATQMLDKKIAPPKVVEIAKATVGYVEAGLDAPSATAAVLASELYESRAIATARGEYLNIPDVSRFTLSAILRGRVEEINGWALYEMDNPTESVLRLRRAVSVLPVDSAWWRSGMWRLGSALALSGKDAEALEAYIKCYKSGTADAFRYGVIESLYKRLNGNTEGLEAKIGAKPAPPASIAQKAEPKPTPEVKAATPSETKTEPAAAVAPEIKPEIKNDTPKTEPPPTETALQKIEPKPTPGLKVDTLAQTKTEPVATSTPKAKIDVPKTEPSPTEAVAQKVEPKPTPEVKAEIPAEIKTPPVTTTTSEIETNAPKTEQTPTASSEAKINPPKPVVKATPDASKTTGEKPKEPGSDSKPTNPPKELFPPVVITIPQPEAGKSVNKDAVAKPEPQPSQAETKPADEPKPDPVTPEKKTEPASTTVNSRPRVVDSKPTSEIKPCVITSTDESLSLKSGGSDVAVIIRGDGDGDLEGLTATSNSPKNISVHREPIEGVTSRAIFVVKSISPNAGMYQIKFEMPCGKKEMLVKVR